MKWFALFILVALEAQAGRSLVFSTPIQATRGGGSSNNFCKVVNPQSIPQTGNFTVYRSGVATNYPFNLGQNQMFQQNFGANDFYDYAVITVNQDRGYLIAHCDFHVSTGTSLAITAATINGGRPF